MEAINSYDRQAEQAASDYRRNMHVLEIKREQLQARKTKLSDLREELYYEKQNNLELLNSFQEINKRAPFLATSLTDALQEAFSHIDYSFEESEEELKVQERTLSLKEDQVEREFKEDMIRLRYESGRA